MKIYKAAVIGLGQIGLTYDFDPKRERPSSHVLAYQLHPRVELVAASDARQEQEQALQTVVPGTRFYASTDELLRNHQFDIISICTPAQFHLTIIQDILHNFPSKIIFCEKPLVNSLKEANLLKKQLMETNCLLVPNLSRRWNSGMLGVKNLISGGDYGQLQKIHVRYTRGILNTGAHLFDLIHWWAGPIDSVHVLQRVKTSADQENDPTFTFAFTVGSQIIGYAEAFDDTQYYLFEIDLYFSKGKLAIRNSGDSVSVYQVGDHPLFSGFQSLHLQRNEENLLAESNLANAVSNLVSVLDGDSQPLCTVDDGLYPLFVAQALLRSHSKNGSQEKVEWL